MSTKQKFLDFTSLFKNSFKSHGIEMGLFFATFILWILDRNNVIDAPFLVLVPILMTAVYSLNKIFQKWPYRLIYYGSFLLLLLVANLDGYDHWSRSAEYVITVLILCPLTILLCRRAKKNEKFVDELLSYIYASVFSFGISFVVLALVSGINLSFLYIFGLDVDQNMGILTEYTLAAIFCLLFPSIFFTFLSYFFEIGKKGGRFFDILINYIFTPALLIYTIILYIYFFRILLLWELPKGGIAYMVFAFTILAIAVKVLRDFLSKASGNFFFDKFSLIALPALLMFWIGLARRVSEFGLTPARVYLLVCGVIMSVFVIALMKKTWSSYFYLFSIMLFIGLCMVCIPFLSAQKLALTTQYATARRLSESSGLKLKDYQRLFVAIDYLDSYDRDMLNTLKVKSKEELLLSLPSDLKVAFEENEDVYTDVWLSDDTQSFEMDIPSEFYKIRRPSYTFKNDSLKMFWSDGDSCSFSMSDIMESQIKTTACKLCESDLQRLAPRLLLYENEVMLIKFNTIRLRLRAKKTTIRSVEIDFVLLKREKE